jgi:hypothetical protein
VNQNARAAFAFATGKYGIPNEVTAKAFADVAEFAMNKQGAGESLVNAVLSIPAAERSFVRELAARLPAALAVPAIAWLGNNLAQTSARALGGTIDG